MSTNEEEEETCLRHQPFHRQADNPKKAFGVAKSRLSFVPMNIIRDDVAEVMALGATKYGHKNWRKQPIDTSTYYDAAHRHLIAWFEDGEDVDPESKKSHLAHVICCMLIILDGLHRGELIDDRAKAEVLTAGIGS